MKSIGKIHDSYRGSRKHVLDWLETGREAFSSSLTALIQDSGAVITVHDQWMPIGYDASREAKLDRNDLGVLTPKMMEELAAWWLVHRRGANVPNWDLAASCVVDGKKGLLLIEAKANKAELKNGGKRLGRSVSKNQEENHAQIGRAIEEARKALCQIAPAVHISRERNYQFSNRVAFAWKLATFSIPVVLVYLGFLGDNDMPQPFCNNDHWQFTVRNHIKNVFPEELIEGKINCGPASIQILIRSKPIIEVSTPNKGNRSCKKVVTVLGVDDLKFTA